MMTFLLRKAQFLLPSDLSRSHEASALVRGVTIVVRRQSPGLRSLSTIPSSSSSSSSTASRAASESSRTPASLTVGLLRETYDKWERRAPLTPNQCYEFLQQYPQCRVVVQPSSHRIFSNTQYEEAGATVKDDLSSAQLILGVKRPQSMEYLPTNNHKTYMFFSHVIKGQPENMVREM
jgi:hypothetical protein